MKGRNHGIGFLLLALAMAASELCAQPLTLVKDLEPGLSPNIFSFGPRLVVAVNGRAVIRAGGQLWASDGTAGGTIDIAALAETSSGFFTQVLAATAQRAYLLQPSGAVAGARVWRTDGTRAGTFVLRNTAGVPLTPTFDSRGRTQAALSGDGVLVKACAELDCGFWFGRGSSAASTLLAPLASHDQPTLVALGEQAFYSLAGEIWTLRVDEPTPRLVFGAASGDVRGLIAYSGRLFFVAAAGAGDEVWVSDGTAGGTRPLTAFPNQVPLVSPLLHPTGGRVVFVADDGTHGQELWSTDGTVAATRRETNFEFSRPFGAGLDPFFGVVPQIVGGRLLFGATDGVGGMQLWVKDGAGPVSALLEPCGPGCVPLLAVGGLAAVGGRVLFVAADPDHGYETWSSDGTRAGTRLLADGCPGSCGTGSSLGSRIQALGDRAVYWTARDLWLSDGTPAGTASIFHGEIAPLLDEKVVRAGANYFFSAPDQLYGREIWVSKGTRATTRVVNNLLSDALSGAPEDLAQLGNRVIFTTGGAAEPGLWVSDGSSEGTLRLRDWGVGGCGSTAGCETFTPLGGIAFFVGSGTDHRTHLWRTDGTVAGTIQLTFGEEIEIAARAVRGGELFFLRRLDPGMELWSSDGTPGGTRPRFVLPGIERAWGLTAVGGELYFVGLQGDGSHNLWRTDGTLAGTRPVSDFPPESHSFSEIPAFVRLGEWIYFEVHALGLGFELWRTGGSVASTAMVARLSLGQALAFQGALYGFRYHSFDRYGLWRLDPESGSAQLIAEFDRAGPEGPSQLLVWQDHLFFVAESAAAGRELWRSDGTPAGTALVRDIRPGAASSAIAELTPTANGLYFSADDGRHGAELWRSDGTAAGTFLVEDLRPSATGSGPTQLTVAGGKLLFAATEDRYGNELWSLDLEAARACVATATALCLNGGRFRVTADWRDFAGNTGVGHATALTADTGYFWFFDPANVEVILKVLDGRGLNAHHWVFYGALSSVEYTLTVTDVQTGAVRRYFNPRGQFASVGDTQGFGPLGAFGRTPAPGRHAAPALAASDSPTALATCAPTAARLCLNGGRFAVEASWKDFAGGTGTGKAVPLTGDTGYFWFFDAGNVEVVLKVLDGRPLNGKFWVFYGALSNVEYTLTVTDTATGKVRAYRNPLGSFGSVGDTSAF